MAKKRPMVRRVAVGGIALYFLVCVLMTLLIVPGGMIGARGWHVAWPIAIFWAGFAIAFLQLRKYERQCAALIASDWRRCSGCFFDLRGLSEKGRCPECGEEFAATDLQAKWKEIVGPDLPRFERAAKASGTDRGQNV